MAARHVLMAAPLQQAGCDTARALSTTRPPTPPPLRSSAFMNRRTVFMAPVAGSAAAAPAVRPRALNPAPFSYCQAMEAWLLEIQAWAAA